MHLQTAPEIWFPHLGIEITKLSREVLRIPGIDLPIYWYGVFIVLGAIAGLQVALIEARRTGQSQEMYYDLLFLGLILALLCARLYYVIFSWSNYKDNLLHIFSLREGGLAIYGGVVGAILAGLIIAHIKKVKFLLVADTGMTGMILGQAVGRWGNFFNREAFGGYTDNLFAMRLLKSQANGLTPELLANTVYTRGAEYIQVHPTFLYESVWNVAVFIALTLYRPHKKFDGEVLLFYLMGYGLGRFFIEGLRTDQLMLFGTGLPVSQCLSALLFVAAAVTIPLCRRRVSAKAEKD